MDLQIIRNLERFFELSGMLPNNIEQQMVFHDPPFNLLLELRDERLLLTCGYRDPLAAKVLPILLQHWQPECTFGVVLRPFLLFDEVLLNCAVPEESQADLWYQLYGLQRRLLLAAIQQAQAAQ